MKKIISIIMCICLGISTFAFADVSVNAATFGDINQSSVFVKQQTNYTCTLASAVMLVRRASMMAGKSNWSSVTESSMRSTAWVENSGLRWSFTYNGISVGHGTLSGGSGNKSTLISLLSSHPEGIVAYNGGNSNQWHAVLLTDYTNGTFYCADPAGNTSGRVALSSSTIKGSGQDGKLANFNAYWYVTSPKVSLSGSHTHSYTTYYGYENTHPHRLIYSCSCGAKTSISNTKYYYDQCSTCKQANISEGWYRIALTQNKNYVMGASDNTTNIRLQVYDKNSDSQKVYLKYVGNGMYTIRFKKQGENMHVINSSGNACANIRRYTADGSKGQEFAFIPADNGGYFIKPKCGWNTLLDLYSNSVKNGTDIWTYTPNFSVAQNWTLISEEQKVNYNANGGKISSNVVCTYANGINQTRDDNQLIIYNKSATSTGTNKYGTEAIIDNNNKVTAIKTYGQNNTTVPSGKGFVISGHCGENISQTNSKSNWVYNNIKVGNYVTYDAKTLKVNVYKNYSAFKKNNTTCVTNEKIGTLPTVSRIGYAFKGWYTSKSGGTKVTTLSKNVSGVLYAHWALLCTPTVSGCFSKVYNEKPQTQNLIVKCGKTTLKNGVDYTIRYYNNLKVGKASIKVTLQGNYSGTKTVTFNINPKTTTLKTVKPGKKQVTINWNKQTIQTSGYQIEYSTSSDFKRSKIIEVSDNSHSSKTIKGLSGKKKYYFRIRTYKNVDSKKYYSAWSGSKKTTTKK